MKKFYKLFLVFLFISVSQSSFSKVVNVTIVTKDLTCNTSMDGEAYVDGTSIVSTGTGPYEFIWSGGVIVGQVTTDTIKNLDNGFHNLRVRDLSDGTLSNFFLFQIQDVPPLQAITDFNDVSCFGVCDGKVWVTGIGGTPMGGLNQYSYQWDDPALTTTDTAFNLCPGTYNITITDANNCTAVNLAVVGSPTQIIPNAVATPIDCNGANNGAVTSTPSGGSGAGYTFLWNDPSNSTSQTINGLMPNNYTVTVTDGTGCTATQTVSVTEPTILAVTVSTNDVACFGGTTGSATATPTGGTTPYTYIWPAGIPFANTTNNLAAGNYIVTVDDANGCRVTQSFIINSNTEINIDLDSVDVDCNGNLTGEVTATITGGRPNYSWTMTGGFSGNTPTISQMGLAAGTYRVTVMDALSCTKIDSIVVNEPPVLAVNVDMTMDPSCVGGTDGSIDITITGGTTPYSVAWDDGNTTDQDRTGLGANTYNLVVTDANGCTANTSATLNDPAPILGNIVTQDPKCRGGNDGVAIAIPSGGSGTYVNYEWSSMNGTDSIETGLSAGNYTVTITDSDGCTSATSFTVTQPAVLFSVTVNTNDVACFGESTGSATAIGTGGAGPYTFIWSGGNPIANSTTNLSAGNYTVTSTDANGCELINNFMIIENTSIAITLDSTDVDCNGNFTGGVTAVITGGRPMYSWIWSDPVSTAGTGANATAAPNLAAGTYRISVTDALGCTAVDSIVVNEPTPLIVTVDSQTDPLCAGDNNGTISITASGGTPNVTPPSYTYKWSDNPTVEDRTNLSANTYIVTVTDANGCTATTMATLTDPLVLTAVIDSLEDVSCNGLSDGFARVSVTGGTGLISFDWGGGVTTRSNAGLMVGTYIVTVTDANNCQTTATAVIAEPTLLTASASSTMASCSGINDGTATAAQAGGTSPYTYAWSDPLMQTNITATNLLAGTYTVTVTDANNCTATATTTVTEPSTIVLSIDNQTNVDCNGNSTGSATIGIVGGTAPINFQWDDPLMQSAATATNLAAGIYNVVATDVNGCNETIQVNITEPPLLTATITAQTNPTCNGVDDGTATVTEAGGTGPYVYLWSSNGQTTPMATGLSGTTHTVTVTDANNCTAIAQVTLTAPASVIITTDAQTNVNCFGESTGSLDLSITGGTLPYVRNWLDIGVVVSEDRNSLSAGSYTLRVTDANGCFVEETYLITEPSSGLTSSFDTTDVSCNGLSDGNAKIIITGGTGTYNYDWEGNPNGDFSDSIFNLAANSYRVTVTDANGCTLVDSTVINEPSPIVISVDAVTNVPCNGDATGGATVSATGGAGGPYIFTWSTTPPFIGPSISGLAAGSYTVTATDGDNCSEVTMVNIVEPDTLRPALFTYDATCGIPNSGSAAIRTTGGVGPYTYVWAPDPGVANGQGTDSIFNQTAGNYFVTVTDFNGCDSIQTFTIQSINSSYTYVDSVRNDSCFGQCNGYIEIIGLTGGVTPYSFSWSGPSGPIAVPPTASLIDNLCAGVYTVTISDATGCDSITTYTITEPADLTSSFNQNDVSCNGFSDGNARVTAVGGTMPYFFTWEAGVASINDSIFNLAANTYRVTITDANNCVKIDSVTIMEPDAIVVSIDFSTDVLCNGDATGTATVSAIGGDGNYVFTSNAAVPFVGSSISGLTAGSYIVTATDGNNCTGIQTLIINEPSVLSPTLFINNVGCGGPNGGSAAIRTTTGGVGPYTYLWAPDPGVANGQGTDSIFNQPAGNYSVTVTDFNGCDSIQTFTINSSNSTFTFTDSVRNDSCGGAGNGYIEIIGLSGGLAPYNFRWSNDFTNNTPINDNLVANNYSLTITDAAGCDSILNFTLTDPPSIIASIVTIPDTCIGNVGRASASVSGGTPPYTITWPGPVTGSSVSGLAAGNYFVTITDANLCEIIEPFTVGNVAPFSIVITTREASCAGFKNGLISVSTSGATNPVTYTWGPGTGLSGANPGLVFAGSYPITVTDANGCAAIDTAVVTQPLGLVIRSVKTTDESCNPGGDGTAVATTIGGTMPYTYDWGNGPTAMDSIGNLSAGNYNVTVRDANFCSWIENFTINSTAPFTIDNPIVTNALCSGDNNGSIQINLTGAIPPITYTWPLVSGLTGPNPTNVRKGTYVVTVTDGTLCSATATATVTEESTVNTSFSNKQNESCSPGMDGFAVVDANGGVEPYIYNWSAGVIDGAGTDSAFNLAAGFYNVTVVDALMCTKVAPVTIDPAANITVTAMEVQPDCFGGSNGSLTVSATGGLAPYSYEWFDMTTGDTKSNLTAGIYSLTITDASVPPCIKVESVTLGQPSPLSISISTTIETCVPGNDAQANVRVTGGTAPFNFSFTGSGTVGATPNVYTNLTEGAYSVLVTDANGCQRSEPFNIISAQDFSLTLTSKDPTCANGNDGEFLVNVNGGTNPLVYNWSGGISGADPKNVSAGTYNITVTDNFGCSAQGSGTLVDRSPITATFVIIDESCVPGNDGAAKATASGGQGSYTYEWPGLAPSDVDSIINFPAGNYNVTITDDSSCVSVIPFTIGSSAPFTVSETIIDATCKNASDGSITLTVTGVTTPNSETYQWSPNVGAVNINNKNQSNLTAGMYLLTVTDPANGCQETETYIVGEPDTLEATALIVPVGCNTGGNDGRINLTVTGGTQPYTFNWIDNGSPSTVSTKDRSNLSIGNYSVTIIDLNNCSFTDTYNITNQGQITIDLDSFNVSCPGANDGRITTTTSANNPTYTWNPNFPSVPNLTNIPGGKYFVTVTDGLTNCFAIDSIVVNEPDPITTLFTISDENCFPGNDGVASASTTGGTAPYNYTFSGGNVIGNNAVDQLVAGMYTVTISDQRNCSKVEMFTVGLAAPFTANFITTDPDCAGDSTGTASITVINSSGPVVFAWPPIVDDPSLPNQTKLPAGTYNVTVSDPANGCSEVLPIVITEPDSIKSNASIVNENCNPGGNGSIDINPTGGDSGPYTYLWSPVPNPVATQQDQTGLSAGKYFVTITDGVGCASVDSFIVKSIINTVPNLSTLNDGCNLTTICVGEAKANPQGGVAPYIFTWSGPSGPIIVPPTADSIGNLCSGNYSLTITDASGCDTIIAFTIDPKRTILPNEVIMDESCNGNSNGEISVTPSGGQEPYTYNWSIAGIPTTNSLVTGLAPGAYTVTINDASGCDTIVNVAVGTESFDYSLDSTDISCNGTNDGRADITIVGGSSGFTFNWSGVPNPSLEDQLNLSAGKYLVTITNTANGCVIVDSTVINPKTTILPNEVVTNESCNSFNDGRIVLTPTGGISSSYSYVWAPNVSTNDTAKNLSGGVYNVTISDASGCDTALTVTIQSSPLITAVVVTQDLTCATSGVCNGKAYVTPSNGIPPYNYNWGVGVVTGVTPDTAISLCLGNYNLTITDAGGCSIVESFTIGGPTPIAPNFSVTNSTCNIANGQLSVNPSGGSGTYTVEWFDAMSMSLGTSNSISSLAAGAYSVVITDNTGCSATFNTAVNDNGAASVTTSSTNVTCFNGNDGTATASFVCNDPNCTVEWFTIGGTKIATTNTVSGLIAGDYYVEVVNNSGCKAVGNVTVSQPTQFQIFATITDNLCDAGANGAINLNVSGGTGSYNYIWSPAPATGQNTNSVGGLLSTTYSVTISDGNSCDSVMTFSITEPQVLNSVFTITNSNCGQADGKIVATVSGGTVTANYDYQWFDSNNTILVGETSDTLKNIASGSYALRVKDDNLCEKRFNVNIGDLNGPTVVIDSKTDAGCFGENNGSIFITASGNNAPFTYNWLPNGETTEDISNLSEGSYSVIVTDAAGCITTISDTIRESTELMATIVIGEASCGLCNGTATASITGGTAPYSYLWSNGGTGNTANALCGGNYTVVVTDASGCSKTFNFGVNTIGGPTGETVIISPPSCANSNDGSATVTPIGGTPPYSYLWQHNGATTNTLNNLAAGTYFLQISDIRSCSRTVQVDITGPPAIVIMPQVTAATCGAADGSIFLDVTGGQTPYSFNWGAGVPDVNFRNGLTANVYSVTVTDANGCTARRNIAVNNTGVAAIASPSATDVSCPGLNDGSLIANVSGAPSTFDFQWFFVQGGPVTAINTDIINGAIAGDYVLEITTIPLGCKSFYFVTIDEPTPITLSSSIIKNVSCNGSCDGEIFVNTIGGNLLYSYSWNDPNNQQQIPANGLCAGTYSVTATDANGCMATTSVTLTDPPALVVNISSTNSNLLCSSDCDASATSVVTGGEPGSGYDYKWSGGQTVPNPTNLCFGINTLTVTDSRGCQVTDMIEVTATEVVIAESLGKSLYCDGELVNLLGDTTGPSITGFEWRLEDKITVLTSTTLDTSFVRPVGTSTYYLIAFGGTSLTCNDTAIAEITVSSTPVVGIESPLRVFADNVERIMLSNEDQSYTFLWTPSTDLDDVTLAEPITSTRNDITYTVLVTDTNNCTYVDSVEVLYTPNIEIPSGFTPNGDGVNDVWNIEYLDEFPNASVQIYNRWGTLLYETKNGYLTPWDGKYEGKKLSIGTYYYIIDLNDSKFKPLTGPVTIVK